MKIRLLRAFAPEATEHPACSSGRGMGCSGAENAGARLEPQRESPDIANERHEGEKTASWLQNDLASPRSVWDSVAESAHL